MTTCPLCDLTYEPTFGPDINQHRAHCNKVTTLKEQYGELFGYRDREVVKRDGWDLVKNKDLPIAERVKGAEMILWSWFSRSVLAAMSNKHPDFPAYAAMILNQEHSRGSFPEPILTTLIERYGQQPGIPEGKSYWQPQTHKHK